MQGFQFFHNNDMIRENQTGKGWRYDREKDN